MFDLTAEKSTVLLNKMVDFTALKQKVIANNIANVNTPGYKHLDVSFKDNLQDALRNDAPVEDVRLSVEATNREGADVAERNDGNTVDIDREVGALMQNALSHNVYLELMSKKFKMMGLAMRTR